MLTKSRPGKVYHQEILRVVDTLSLKRAKIALAVLKSLKQKDGEWEATAELLSDEKLMQDVVEAKRDLQKSTVKKLTSWRKLRAAHV